MFLAVALCTPLHLQAEEWTIERFQRAETSVAPSSIEIVNRYGDVRIRSSGIDELEVVANIQRMADDPYRAAVRIGEDTEPLRIEVEWVLRDGAAAAGATAEMAKRRVDLTVILPARTPLHVETDGGLIEAKGHAGAVTAESVSGDIRLKTAGSVTVRSDRGAVDTVFTATDWQQTPTIETVTGDTTVWLPPDAHVTVTAETTGEISTDYSIEIRREPPDERKLAKATIGGGESRLEIRSVKGRVRMFRSPG